MHLSEAERAQLPEHVQTWEHSYVTTLTPAIGAGELEGESFHVLGDTPNVVAHVRRRKWRGFVPLFRLVYGNTVRLEGTERPGQTKTVQILKVDPNPVFVARSAISSIVPGHGHAFIDGRTLEEVAL